MLYNVICQILFPLSRIVFTTLWKAIRYHGNMAIASSEPDRVAESIISECGKNTLRNVAKMPYMLRKCLKTLQECPKHVAKMP